MQFKCNEIKEKGFNINVPYSIFNEDLRRRMMERDNPKMP